MVPCKLRPRPPHRELQAACILLVVVAIAAPPGTTFATSPQNGLELLLQVADAHQANLDKIESWSGTVIMENAVRRNDDSDYRFTAEVQFWSRPETDQLASIWRRLQYESTDNRKPGFPLTQHVIVTADRFVEVSRWEGSDVNTNYIWPRNNFRRQHGFGALWIDPLYFLGNGDEIPKFLRFLHDLQTMTPEAGWSATRQDHIITVRCQDDLVTNQYTFDMDRSGALVRYFGQGAGIQVEYEWDYQQLDGVWVPRHWSRHQQQFAPGFDGSPAYDSTPISTHTRTVAWQQQELNQSIDDQRFTLANAGLKPGEIVIDRASDTVFRYDPNAEQ